MVNKRQHAVPILVSSMDKGYSSEPLEQIELVKSDDSQTHYDEEWLQHLFFEHPGVLPVSEIEPAFVPLFPVCEELHTKVGQLDNLFVSENGSLTLVECKLWRNAEARRKVVGQILDYAQELANWSYEDLDQALIKKDDCSLGLFDIISQFVDDLDESRFIDAVSRNLKRGRFLLLIVGDGIREEVENIVNYLQAHAGLDFTFALVELALFKMPSSNQILVQPRTIAQTFAIERAVVTVESGDIKVSAPKDFKVTSKQAGRRTTISEDQFYEKLEESMPEVVEKLKTFVDDIAELGVFADPASSSLNLKWKPEGNYTINFGSIRTNGDLDTEPTNWHLRQILNNAELAYPYLESLKATIPNAELKNLKHGAKKVVINGQEPPVSLILQSPSQWKKAISELQHSIVKSIEES